ncbi:hypothetical protein ACJJIG_00980 [Microbulbifer sp. SSSA007]|uniref:hypothetical protein n=1 Tax=Microbulbifer sp. SSSA007 TaxID=3243379 RepID=UPI004039F038
MKQFSELTIKILAAYLVLSNLGNALPFIIAPASWGISGPIPIAPVLGSIVVPAVIGIILWVLAPKIAPKIIRSTDGDASISEKGLVAAGTFLIGVYWALKSVGVIVGQLFTQGTINYGYVTVLLISLAMIFGGRFVTTMYHRLRTAGTGV